MTQDEDYQVIYNCSKCDGMMRVDGPDLAQIKETYEDMGWGNVETPGMNGKVDYIVFCPKCYEKEQVAIDDHAAHMAWLDSQDYDRTGLW